MHKDKAHNKKRIARYIPEEQYEAILKVTQQNAYNFATEIYSDLTLIALHREFGFGKDRIGRVIEAVHEEVMRWQADVQWEYDAETTGMRLKEKQNAPIELSKMFYDLDEDLKDIVPEKYWKPAKVRYGKFGGSGSWCKDQGTE